MRTAPTFSNLTRGYALGVLSAAILSTTAIFIRYLTSAYAMPALVLALWRDAFVALTLLPVLAALRPHLLRLAPRHLPYLAFYGLMLAIFNSLWVLSVAQNGAAISTVLVYSSAGFTALLGRWLFAERLDWAKLLAIALSLGGCALVAEVLSPEAWRTNLLGILTGILSGLWYSIYSLMGRSASQRGLNPWTTLFFTFGFASLFLLLANASPWARLPGAAARPGEIFWLGKAAAGWGILFLLAAGPTLLGFGLYNVSLAYLPSSLANLILTLEPAFTAVSAYVLFGERLNAVQLLGSLMILAGVVLPKVSESWMAGRARLEPQR